MKDMTPLDISSKEFNHLKDYLDCFARRPHILEDVFQIERNGEMDRLQKYTNNCKSNRRLLWHWSRSTNFAGILGQGLRTPPEEAPACGYRWGKGIYLNDVPTPALEDRTLFPSGTAGLLLLCEVELGNEILKITADDYNGKKHCFDTEGLAREKNCLSILVAGPNVPVGWKDAGCLDPSLEGVSMLDTTADTEPSRKYSEVGYNEYIVYEPERICLKYLAKVVVADVGRQGAGPAIRIDQVERRC
jgi:poly [ADP-ribose] polymerase